VSLGTIIAWTSVIQEQLERFLTSNIFAMQKVRYLMHSKINTFDHRNQQNSLELMQ